MVVEGQVGKAARRLMLATFGGLGVVEVRRARW
jgi:hypothetical protein